MHPPPARVAFAEGAALADALADGSSSGGGGGGGGVTTGLGCSDTTTLGLAGGCGERVSFQTISAPAIKSMMTAART